MRIYAYVRLDPNINYDIKMYIDFFHKYGYQISGNRLILEEVTINTSILYRDKIVNLINYGLEEGDLLVVESIDCLGGNFEEMCEIVSRIDKKNIKLICLDYSKTEIVGDLKIIFKHFLKICMTYESKLKNRKVDVKNNFVKRVGRPEILNYNQKEEVLNKFKRGYSVYSLAKEYGVTRTVIQRVLDKATDLVSKSEKNAL
ncbi:recombinase family protein [Acinetobacter seifertii]|uniref:recombinase family protein n=1 Tax=Acinetobacter seifertii TaxID=1530123 RepID=UPI00280E442B|nr:recombinase family protein [Acinetobacter seifertii]MDQ9037264.1 recombinase family protein [Acinetobacter seifertii]